MKTSGFCKCLTKLRADHADCMSSFRGIRVLFPWRHCPPIRCEVKGLKSKVDFPAVCLLKHREPHTQQRHPRVDVFAQCNDMRCFFSSSFWGRTLNGINTKVPGLHLVFPWLLKNLSSGFKWSGMQVCVSSLIASYITFSYFSTVRLFFTVISHCSPHRKLSCWGLWNTTEEVLRGRERMLPQADGGHFEAICSNISWCGAGGWAGL